VNYITRDELIVYYDKRRLYQLLSDDGTPVTDGTYAANALVTTALRQASAMIDAACQTGRRYERTQLEDVVTAANAVSATEAELKRAEPIKSLAAHLAFGFIVSRRGYAAQKMTELAPMFDWAQEQLNLLATGQRIFDLDGPKTAGVPRSVQLGSKLFSWSQSSPMFGMFPTTPATYLYPYPYGG
jgi:hypothetical protein